MAKWAHSDILDNGLAYLKANCNKVILTSAYTSGDSYATVVAATLAEATTATGDYTLAGAAGAARTCTLTAGKQDASANASGTASHIAFVDTATSKVLAVTTETSGQSITSGNPVTFPAIVYTAGQPT